MPHLLIRSRILRLLAVDLCPLFQRLSVSDSSAHISPHQPQESACARSQRRRHDLDLVERWQRSNETGPTSLQAVRGPPWGSSTHVVRDSSFA